MGYSYSATVNKCYLKGAVTGTYAKEGIVTRRKHKAPSEPASCSVEYGKLETGRDLAGKFLKAVSGSSEAACCSQCDKTDGCEGYSYASKWKKCYLKGALTGTFAKEGIVTRRKHEAPSEPASCSADYGKLETGRDLAGKFLKAVSGSSEAACCSRCDKTDGCEGYSYASKYEKCYLKGAVTGTYAKEGIVTRRKHEAPSEPASCSADYGKLETGRDLAGKFLKAVSGSSEA